MDERHHARHRRQPLTACISPLVGVEPQETRADLRALNPIIDGASVIGLGEATHGTREFVRLSHRLFEWLVEEHGFTVLTLEAQADWVDGVVHAMLKGSKALGSQMSSAPWMSFATQEWFDLVNWVAEQRAAGRDLHLYGVSPPRILGMATIVVNHLQEVAQSRGAKATIGQRIMASASTFAEENHLPTEERADMEEWRSEAEKALADSGARALLDLHILLRTLSLPKDGASAYEARDTVMGETVLEIVERVHPGSRALVLGHNMHIDRRGWRTGVRSMGTVISERLNEIYVPIGATFGRGSFSAFPPGDFSELKEFEAPEVLEGSIEDVMGSLVDSAAVFDLSRVADPVVASLSKRRRIRWVGYDPVWSPTGEPGWDEVDGLPNGFDAFIYIEDGSPYRPLVQI